MNSDEIARPGSLISLDLNGPTIEEAALGLQIGNTCMDLRMEAEASGFAFLSCFRLEIGQFSSN